MIRKHVITTAGDLAKRPAKKARRRSEASEQREFVAWARARGLFFFHVPNQLAARSRRHGAALKALGVTAGVPDIVILDRVVGSQWRGLALEFKGPNGVLSPAQRAWHIRARALGWRVEVVRSAAEAIRLCGGFVW